MCSIELEANMLHDNSEFRIAAGNKGRFLYVFDRSCGVNSPDTFKMVDRM